MQNYRGDEKGHNRTSVELKPKKKRFVELIKSATEITWVTIV